MKASGKPVAFTSATDASKEFTFLSGTLIVPAGTMQTDLLNDVSLLVDVATDVLAEATNHSLSPSSFYAAQYLLQIADGLVNAAHGAKAVPP